MKTFQEISVEELYAVEGGSIPIAYELGKTVGRVVETGVDVVASAWESAGKAWDSYANAVNDFFGIS